MTASLVRALALALSVAALSAAAAPATATAAGPPVLTSVHWTLRVTAGSPAGFIAEAVDPDGGPVTIAWTFDDGTFATGARVTKVWTTPGRHTARVTATDITGKRTMRKFAVEVLPVGTAPLPGAPPTAGHMPRPGPAPVARASVPTTALRLTTTNAIPVRVRCERGADCTGTVSVARSGRRLAAAHYEVGGGRRATIRLRVPATAARALRRRPGRRVSVVVTVAPQNGAAARVDGTLRVG
ncbi:MAG TPA: PKD domain-containing protein [Solirubrobacteraceae bacterium]|nr:PKD domain-containing protein [Solirubrobacteraceae bacterium]